MPPSYHVIISNKASADLTGIFEYIRRDSPENAANVIRRILDGIDGLASMPSRFGIAGGTRKRDSRVHKMVIRPFLVYYRVDDSPLTVTVLRVRHGARRQPKRFD